VGRRSEARNQTGFVGSTNCSTTAPGPLESEKSKCEPRLIGNNSGITGNASTSVELFGAGRGFGSGTTFPFLLSSSGRARFSSNSTISISSGVAGRSSGSLSLTSLSCFASIRDHIERNAIDLTREATWCDAPARLVRILCTSHLPSISLQPGHRRAKRLHDGVSAGNAAPCFDTSK
jgi:hypothetical protein